MNRLMIASLCIAGLLGIPACATQHPGAAGYERGPASAGVMPLNERYCLRRTGTHIDLRRHQTSEQDCIAAGGRVYTRADLESTGAVDIAEALRKLDPAIQ